MEKAKVVLHFPKNLVDKPFVYRLVKDFNLEFNILKAEIDPQDEGLLILELRGSDVSYKKALDYLKKSGIGVQPLSKDIFMDESKCVDCTVCVPLCPSKALVRKMQTSEVEFLEKKCIACGICVKACPYGAMRISFG